MVLIFGIGLLLAGLFMMLRLYRNSRRPRVEDARVMEVNMEYYEFKKGHVSPRKMPVARVEYFYRSVKYTVRTMLKLKSIKAGDTIQLSVDPRNPEKVEHYSATREFGAALLVSLIGVGLIVIAWYVSESLN